MYYVIHLPTLNFNTIPLPEVHDMPFFFLSNKEKSGCQWQLRKNSVVIKTLWTVNESMYSSDVHEFWQMPQCLQLNSKTYKNISYSFTSYSTLNGLIKNYLHGRHSDKLYNNLLPSLLVNGFSLFSTVISRFIYSEH